MEVVLYNTVNVLNTTEVIPLKAFILCNFTSIKYFRTETKPPEWARLNSGETGWSCRSEEEGCGQRRGGGSSGRAEIPEGWRPLNTEEKDEMPQLLQGRLDGGNHQRLEHKGPRKLLEEER